MDRLLAIRVFDRLVETGGFGRAAEALDMPKSTVTKLIQGLERELGVRLLDRTTRRVTVTAEGAAYYEHTRHWLADLDDFETTLAAGRGNPVGTLRIDTGGSVAAGLILPRLAEFRARYPGIRLQVGVTDRTIDLVSEGVDCAIRSTNDDTSLVTRQIAELRWSLCASPDYLARRGAPSTPEDIHRDAHDVVGYFSARTGRMLPLRFRRAGEDIAIDAAAVVQVNESNAHTAAVLAGLGLAQTLAFSTDAHVAAGRLVSLLSDLQPPPLPVYLVYPPERRNNARLRAFVDWIADALPAQAASLIHPSNSSLGYANHRDISD
ncbi:LysR family transcriptional regulator [Luteibacter sp. UNCMF366Tsu5.1]|uniref:LysR family transcriptional regulator n=1 Tax=Luteibacter sp. UNCMF366Tsu5.1 TaxID=1502758 RepID=UPI000908AF48|nr:LysR family transcriptional regulator [Luteibacter sp. UNCMF366Tsu5.1]SFW68040.1 DNA-binding transcriptional regulator, LysR family [Luteibacter sp. UNCMF366Tsu5.1]